MRIVVVSLVVLVAALPAGARPHKRKHAAPPAPVAHVVPNDRAAQEHARAEAELADLRAGRVDDKQEPLPPQVWAIQENDKEVPANLRQKK